MPNITFDAVLEKLGRDTVKPATAGKDCKQTVKTLCVCHNETEPSLYISEADNGKVLIHCQGCGADYENVLRKLDLWNGKTADRKEIAAVYDYHDEHGNVLFQTVRYRPKDFRQRRSDGNGGWVWNLNGTRRVLYKLPELLAAEPEAPVFVCEGEKDVDRLCELRLTATACPLGAKKWRRSYNDFLRDRNVCILPDLDGPGREHAAQVQNELHGTAASVAVLELPGMPQGGKDVSDWLDNGGTKGRLLELVAAAPIYDPAQATDPADDTKTAQQFDCTEQGLGERFAKLHGDKVHYDHTADKWRVYDGRRWASDCEAELAELCKEAVGDIDREVMQTSDPDRQGALRRLANRARSKATLQNMLWFASREPNIATYHRQYDTDPWLLNCLNGTLDLRTGELKPHDPKQLITKLCPVKYDPDAHLPLWDNFLATATNADIELMLFLQKATGYSLTGSTAEEKLFFVHGPAASGKSTFLEAIKSAMGEYAQVADFETFLQRNQTGGARNDIAALAGARMVVSIETDEGKRLAEGLVKTLTGGDTVRSRFLYRESFEFEPQFKLWLAANDAPRVRDNDTAIWRRILRVPFEHVIDPADRDPKVKATLKNPRVAGAAILRWAMLGCRYWQEDGLKPPSVVEQATEAYRKDMDPLTDFVSDCCIVGVSEAIVSVAELRGRYEVWARENGLRFTISPRQFNQRLQDKGCERREAWLNGKTQKCWHGIGLRESTVQR